MTGTDLVLHNPSPLTPIPDRLLATYDAACGAVAAALAATASVDEAHGVRHAADLLRLRARQAQNKQLEIDAAELRIRAERRIGEMMALQRDDCGLARPTIGGAGRFAPAALPTLDELGISKHLADRARRYAEWPAERFEDELEARRRRFAAGSGRVTVDLDPGWEKAERRAAREIELASRQRALPEFCYGVIYADPEWQFEPWSRETGMDRSAANHYPTSETETIAARDVAKIAADHCALFLWATAPMLPQALDVMKGWGFAYKSHCVWMKSQLGTGYWYRNAHELLLLGTRGRVPAPAPGAQWPSVVHAPARAHSAKPERFLEMIEEYFPNLPKIELNRRGPARPGWDAWGNEAVA